MGARANSGARHVLFVLLAGLAAGAVTTGCGGGGASPGPPPPPPPPPPTGISVSVAPTSATVMLGATQQFTATVLNTSNTAVNWSVNGVPGGNSTVGTITSAGLYTAPQNLPAQPAMTVEATSLADASKSAAAAVSVASDLSVSVAPPLASVELGATLRFSANVSSAGNPNPAVTWSVSGAGCAGTACGTIGADGVYTAPPVRPAPPVVTLTVRSVADISRTASATVSITSNFTLVVSGLATLGPGSSAQYTATLTPAPNSNPSTAITWSVSGPGCTGAACGAISQDGSYAAPAVAPSPNTLAITATPDADPAKAASLTVTIVSNLVSLNLSPTSATRAVNHRQIFAVQVSGTSNLSVLWQVNGIAGGDDTVGRICAAGSNPCQTVSTTSAATVDYLAPASVPARNPVTVTATSQADPTKSASSQVTILPFVVVSVSPPSVTLAPRATQQFTATVLGTSDQGVVWQITGSGCSAGSGCGTVSANGFYTAPVAAPAPNSLNVTATSTEDTARSGSASVTISSSANISALVPASATAGAAGGFLLRVLGGGFVATSPGPGSAILFNGAAKTTSCASTGECTATLSSSDLAAPGSLPVRVRNPDGTLSGTVNFVVVPDATSDDVIALTPATPAAAGKDILVVEPSTAASDSSGSLNLNVIAIGKFSSSANTCTLSGSPLVIPRPASGTAQMDLCAFSLGGLDPALNYSITGPPSNDISIVAKQPLGLGIIRLTLELSSATLPGPRSLLVENPNKDRTAVTGALEVK